MLTSQQLDTISGITSGYDHYVIYNYADYHNYTYTEDRDSRVYIYVGNSDSITYDGVFHFSEDVQCFQLTYNKYLDTVSSSSSFTVPASELVYTDLVSYYPSIDSLSHEVQRADLSYIITAAVIAVVILSLIPRVFFGRN